MPHLAKTLSSKLSRKGSRDSADAVDNSVAPAQSAYMSENADLGFVPRESKLDRVTGALSRSLSSAKYATVRTAKGIKIGAQEGGERMSSSVSSKFKRGKKDEAMIARSVPSV